MCHDVLTEKICVKIDMKMFFECAIYGTNMAALEMAQTLMMSIHTFQILGRFRYPERWRDVGVWPTPVTWSRSFTQKDVVR